MKFEQSQMHGGLYFQTVFFIFTGKCILDFLVTSIIAITLTINSLIIICNSTYGKVVLEKQVFFFTIKWPRFSSLHTDYSAVGCHTIQPRFYFTHYWTFLYDGAETIRPNVRPIRVTLSKNNKSEQQRKNV